MKFPFLPALLLASAPLAHAAPPNVVILYADDLGYGDISCNGATAVRTPNIDRLAKEGLKFRAGYATASTCTPSRFSLMTGKYPFRQNGTGILPGDAALIIPTGQPTLPSVLKAAGYRTAAVGKWHLGLGGKGGIDWNKPVSPGPNQVGFDHSFIMPATADRVPCVYMEDGRVVGLDPADPIKVSYRHRLEGEAPPLEKDQRKVQSDPQHSMGFVNGVGRIGHMTGGTKALWKDEDMSATFCKQAVDFIRASKDKPFFLYYACHNIHVPRVPGPQFVGKTSMGPRGDSIVEADWQVGEVLRVLDELKLADNTLVILSSDNGPVVNDGYLDQSVVKLGDHKPAGPWRGGKYSNYEGGTRVPFLVRLPGRVKPGTTSDAMVSQVDLARSLAKLAGASVAADAFPDSKDVLPALLGESPTGREEIVGLGSQVTLRRGSWKYIPATGGKKASTPDQLYDLATDPGEKTNLAATKPEEIKQLAARLKEITSKVTPREPVTEE
ncbi:sulfatase-like hydrolase/transferase [Luteolibacter ambystomatis]|uniref:Sulfatase-like hydrolase/transferase n=1 Tax=Luteolibacter ambystomatis TaxID=2824561 RepID=A0A975G5P6_9BACT|nr:arylsulfatase [Luteolibacter ambystomatis]QUE49310.1 sulfatase-like hydrolase/transferase [Luteolibacter ambystomatis]